MIKSIKIFNDLNESIELVLTQPELSGFVVESIDGLGPVKANINRNELSTSDGSKFNSARLSDRNIVMQLIYYEGKETIEAIRQKSYRYFPVKRQIKFQIFTDNRNLEIDGYVESNEPDIFSEREGAQISIICPDPYFRSQEIQTNVAYGIDAGFEFEFENDSLTEPMIEFGAIKQSKELSIYYTGDAEASVTIDIKFVGPVENLSIYNTATREIMRINTDIIAQATGNGLSAGDEVIIDTAKGNRSITLLRGGSYVNILYCLDRHTNWFTLAKGENVFTYTTEAGDGNFTFAIYNQILYEGV